jgi:hypothetical protein
MTCVKRPSFHSRPLAVVEDQGAPIQAAENFAEPVGSFFRRRNEVTAYEGFFMIAPALKEEERPALTDTTGLWDRGNPTIAEYGVKCKATRSLVQQIASPCPTHGGRQFKRSRAFREQHSRSGGRFARRADTRTFICTDL